MIKKINEWFSVKTARKPSSAVLFIIILLNLIIVLGATTVISVFNFNGVDNSMSFFLVLYNTITMVLDAGCINNLVSDVGSADAAILIICITVIIIGMITFTGAVIGYFTNIISGFVDKSNEGRHKLYVSNHTVILNWNSRASEIVNDFLYAKEKEKVVVLVSAGKDEIIREINERLSDTVYNENKKLRESLLGKNVFSRFFVYKKNHLSKNKVIVVVREGDVFSSKQLRDICLDQAKSIIILGSDINNSVCKFETAAAIQNKQHGNPHTIKTLMQVAEITSAASSADSQKIVVEVSDDWTSSIVEEIIKCKQVDAKCNIVPVRVNKILGQILSQFCIMPELSRAYYELFSNQGATFFSKEMKVENESKFISEFLGKHKMAIPLSRMEYNNKQYCFFSADSASAISNEYNISTDFNVELNENFTMTEVSVAILGHNSRVEDILRGFKSFSREWPDLLHILVIDEKEHLEEKNYYKDFAKFFDIKTVEAKIYDEKTITEQIEKFVDSSNHDTSVLLLSDDTATNENIDANVLANLVYIQKIINDKKEKNPSFDTESIDVIVEIINPKHFDVVNKYGNNRFTKASNNVIISNRYVSKMVAQIGKEDSLFNFYNDILSYDEIENDIHMKQKDKSIYDRDDSTEEYNSKEIYIRPVNKFFGTIPEKCTASNLIRAIYKRTAELGNPTMLLGYCSPGGKVTLFSGDQTKINVELDEKTKLIVFSSH